jgi:hypothetical protein
LYGLRCLVLPLPDNPPNTNNSANCFFPAISWDHWSHTQIHHCPLRDVTRQSLIKQC